MVKDEIHNIMYETRQLLEEKEYNNASILYVLENTKDIRGSISGVCDKDYEMYEAVLKDRTVNYCYDWDYNVDEYVLGNMEKEYNIGFMTMEFHKAMWTSIGNVDIEEIEHKIGLQKYLKYCKENNIDKSTIEKETKSENIPDIMKYYEGLDIGSTIEYKGYVIEVDESNLDNDMENLVQIYESKQDYIDGVNIETVSLNSIGLEQNIKDYIEENYIENDSMEISKSEKESEINYTSFILGYDLLNEMLTNSEVKECDINYDFCNYLAKKFIKTDYYKNERKSTYDNLREWVEDNTDIIKSEHLFFTGQDNKVIIETGKRNDEQVALVEHHFKDGTKEYIVAFHYEVEDKKINWGYGYYYNENLEKAKQDFEKVKAGGNLADTFEDKQKHKERER